MKQYEMFEIVLEGEPPVGSQACVDVSAEFICTKEDGSTECTQVKGFYAGNSVYKVRFYPGVAGTYTWSVRGVVNGQGREICDKSDGANKGIVRAVDTHFEYDNGEIYKPFGTTIYALNHQEQKLIDRTMDTLSSAPFNKVRHCVFPKHYDYNQNDPQLYAFEKDDAGNWDVNRPCFAFWDHFEEGIKRLADMGIQSDLILFHPYDKWGFAKLSMEENRIYLDYLLRRFSAIPQVWWSMANEYDLCVAKTMEDWYDIEEFIAFNDPFHHLLSNHNCFGFYDFNRKNITHVCVQTILIEKAAEWMKKYQKPVINDECCYEGDLPLSWGNISAFEMTHRFWAQNCVGAYATHGEVFRCPEEILWWSKGGVLKGESPARIAFLRKIMEEIPGALEPWEEDPRTRMPENMTPEQMQEMMNSPVAKHFMNMSEYDRLVGELKDMDYAGRWGDQVFIKYFGHHCNGVTTLYLPEGKMYRIEIIDAWEMTRTTVMTGVSGKVVVELPGKEGTAVLVKAEELFVE